MYFDADRMVAGEKAIKFVNTHGNVSEKVQELLSLWEACCNPKTPLNSGCSVCKGQNIVLSAFLKNYDIFDGPMTFENSVPFRNGVRF